MYTLQWPIVLRTSTDLWSNIKTQRNLYIRFIEPYSHDKTILRSAILYHHDITDTTSSGPIFSQTSPVVWMKDGERIDLPDTYHMVVSQSNTETVVSVTTRKSVFLNGETNYTCGVVDYETIRRIISLPITCVYISA